MDFLSQIPGGGRIAVVRLRSLGDCVLTTPALEILRRTRPDCRVAVVVEPRFADIFLDHPAVDIVLDPSWAAMVRFRPHLCLNLHGGTRSALLTAASGARWRAAFAHLPWQSIYNIRIPRAQEIFGEERTVHTAEHLASAVFHLGAPRCPVPRAHLTANPSGRSRRYAVLHPMASAANKTWPAERFLAVARHLRDHHELEPVFIAGPGEDVSAFAAFTVYRGRPLREIKNLLASASLFAGNDSGPAHMAAAFGVPVLVLFGASDPVVWAPWRTLSESIVAPAGDPAGLSAIETATVIAALDRLRARAVAGAGA